VTGDDYRKFTALLLQKKGPVVEKWVKLIHATYPSETAEFLDREPNQFANPIGASIQESVWPLYDEIVIPKDGEKARKLLDTLIRPRAVQDFTPAGALSVIFSLKEALREEVMEKVLKEEMVEGLLEIESRIDQLALVAFDVYMQCREKVWEVKHRDLMERPFVLSGGMCPSYMLKRGRKHIEKLKEGN
jgi:hypothetical protein